MGTALEGIIIVKTDAVTHVALSEAIADGRWVVNSAVPMVGVRINVPDDCEMSYEVEPDGVIGFTFGILDDGFDTRYERAALRRFIELSERALRVPIDSCRERAILRANDGVV